MGIQDLQAFLPGGFHRQELGLPCFFRDSWRLYPVSAICAFAIFSGFQFHLFILFHLFPSIMSTSRFPPMVSPDWCLGSQRTSHSGGPQEPGLQPFVIAPTEGVLSLQCIHRLPLAHSTTLEPLRTGPRVLQLPSCNSSVLSIQHFFSGDIAHANATISAGRSPSFSPHPSPSPLIIIVPPSPTDQPQGRLSIAPAGTNLSDRPTNRPLRRGRGLGDPFCASSTFVCKSCLISRRCGFSPSVPRPSSHPPSVVRRPSILGPASHPEQVTNGPCCTHATVNTPMKVCRPCRPCPCPYPPLPLPLPPINPPSCATRPACGSCRSLQDSSLPIRPLPSWHPSFHTQISDLRTLHLFPASAFP